MKFRIEFGDKMLSGSVPDSWDEYTVKHFTTIEAGANDIEILSALSNIPIEAIENTKANIDPIMEHVAKTFNSKPPDLEKAKMGEVVIEGKAIKFPKSLDFTRFGQKSMLKNILQKEEALEKEIAEIFAIYAQPLIDGKFDSQRISQITKIVEGLPIVMVYPYVLFFFRKLSGLKKHFNTKSIPYLQHTINRNTMYLRKQQEAKD